MTPDEVPAELVELGMRAMGMWSKRRDLDERTVRDVLAAVLPEIDRLRADLDSLAANYQTHADSSPTPLAQWGDVAADVRRVAARLTTTTEEATP